MLLKVKSHGPVTAIDTFLFRGATNFEVNPYLHNHISLIGGNLRISLSENTPTAVFEIIF